MNISVVCAFHCAQESSSGAEIEDGCKQSKDEESELLEALLSLAAMVDSARDKTSEDLEPGTSFGGIEKCNLEQRFSFFSGWDRLVSRFRENSAIRNLQCAAFQPANHLSV